MNTDVGELSEDHSMHKPRFVWAFDFGQVLQVISLMIPLGGVLWYQSTVQAEMRRDILNLQSNAATYTPRIENMGKSDDVQNERIGNLSDAVRDIRRTNAEMLAQMSGVREDLAGIKGRLLNGPSPRDVR